MIHRITPADRSGHIDDLITMHRLRCDVFQNRLGWDVTVSGGLEIDEYDALDPIYLLYRRSPDRPVEGCARLLPTTGRYMLRHTFPALLGGTDAPVSPHIWEASRFAVATGDPTLPKGPCGLASATSELFAAMVEIGLQRGLTAIAAVVDIRMERILRWAGWPLDRFAPPRQIGKTLAVAGLLDVSASALGSIRRAGGIPGPVLNDGHARAAA